MEQKKMIRVNRPHTRTGDDRIEELPDDVLVLILSRLTINEAARTSVLSRRWEDLWKYSTGCFDLRAPDAVKDGFGWKGGSGSHLSCFNGKYNYANWVNRVLESHRGKTVNELRVFFKLGKSFEQMITSWINFAIKKQVRVLEMNLGFGLGKDMYTFPSLSHLGVSSFKNLSSLCLSRIDITDRWLADALCNCPLLEELSVRFCHTLVGLDLVTGSNSLVKLKHLEIKWCSMFKRIGISAINLVSFKFIGAAMTSLSIDNAPLLSQLEIGGDYCMNLFSHKGGLLLFHPCKLERLVLDLQCMSLMDAMLVFVEGFVEFSRLNYLELKLNIGEKDEHSMLFLTSMIETCPCLQIFRLEVLNNGMAGFKCGYNFTNLTDFWKRVSRRNVMKADQKFIANLDPNYPLPSKHNHRNNSVLYKCLERVDFVGFCGHPAELELAIYLLENAAFGLKKITIDPHLPCIPIDFMRVEKVEAARESAKQLETKLPSAAELVIL